MVLVFGTRDFDGQSLNKTVGSRHLGQIDGSKPSFTEGSKFDPLIDALKVGLLSDATTPRDI